jgi:glycine/D-amino acid oxidase-like deaminating enzyme
MNRSIDVLEAIAYETGNMINLNRNGYLFATSDPQRIEDYKNIGEEAEALGAGPLRIHNGQSNASSYVPAPQHGFEDELRGSDLILDRNLLREHFPYLTEDAVAAIHVRRAGWLSAQQLGMYYLERARKAGMRLIEGRVEHITLKAGRVSSVQIATRHGMQHIDTRCFVNAAGPHIKQVGHMLGVDLPIFAEKHGKIAISDPLNLVPRVTPLVIWSDDQYLPWSEEEREMLAESEEDKMLLERFPSGVHMRPEGGPDSPILLILWTYDMHPVEPVFPITFDLNYPEIVLRGMATVLPALRSYFHKMPRYTLDGGYYMKTRENRLLAGPLPIEGAYVCGAFSGYGIMASPAASELLAAHITGSALPHYAPAFSLSRYDDPTYQKLLDHWGASGQL